MKPDAQPVVSVLTPVYNGEKYLVECIESVLAQTYQNWEYVIVNNCSTDRTLEIAADYAKRDTRIRIHNNKTFVGCDANGNIAFRQIATESKYCKVVHADDWLFPECIMRMVELAEAHPTVAIVGAYGLRNDQVAWDGLPYARTVISGREMCRMTLMGGPYVFGSPSSLLIRSSEVGKRPAFYNEDNRHCDIEACFDLLRDMDFGFVHQVLTFTRDHPEAETSFSARFGTDYLGTLEILAKYGKTYLSNEEYKQCVQKAWDNYYAFLGDSVFQIKEKAFWTFHSKELKRMSYPLSMAKVAIAVLSDLCDLLFNPYKTFQRIVRKLRHILKKQLARETSTLLATPIPASGKDKHEHGIDIGL
jgi:glycosyltransferase involved in cell wall biosynthesis